MGRWLARHVGPSGKVMTGAPASVKQLSGENPFQSSLQIGHLMNHDVSRATYLTEAAAGRSTLTPFTLPYLTYL